MNLDNYGGFCVVCGAPALWSMEQCSKCYKRPWTAREAALIHSLQFIIEKEVKLAEENLCKAAADALALDERGEVLDVVDQEEVDLGWEMYERMTGNPVRWAPRPVSASAAPREGAVGDNTIPVAPIQSR